MKRRPLPIYAGTPRMAICARDACPLWIGQRALLESEDDMRCEVLGYAPEARCPVVEAPADEPAGDVWARLDAAVHLESAGKAAASAVFPARKEVASC